ncbi:MAG: ABC transporter permease subunit [Rhizobiales bacterium]|nr:ABC transporter permease subunit [Hyphomicrobiales bacterium]
MSRHGAIRTAIVVGLIIYMEVACRLGWVNPNLLVPPSVMAMRLAELVQEARFWEQVASSARSILIAFIAANIAGSAIGLVLHRMPQVRASLEPLIASYYAIPFFVLYPLMIVFFGMNDTPIILIGFLYAVMAVIIGTLSGLDRIPHVLSKTGAVLRMSGLQKAFWLSLPAAAPHLLTGTKLSLSYSITGVLGSEFILSAGGFGYSIAFAYNNFDDKTMYGLLLFLVVAVSIITLFLHHKQQSVQHRSGTAHGRNDATALSKVIAILAVAAIIVTAWQLAHNYAGLEALAPPLTTAFHLVDLLNSPSFWVHINETASALGLALLFSCLLGALIGLTLGASKTATAVSEPMIVTLYSLPKITLYPVFLLFFGIGFTAKVAFGALHGIFPMILISMNAIRSMNVGLRKTARTMKLTRLQTLTHVIVPATVPELVTGLRMSFSITLLGVMVGEMFASSRGLGFLVMNSIDINDTATMMAITTLVAFVAIAINTILLAIDRSLHRV